MGNDAHCKSCLFSTSLLSFSRAWRWGHVKCYLLLKLIITVLHIFHVTISIWVNEKWGSELLKNKFLEIWCWFHILLKNIYTIWYSEFDLPFQRMMSTSWQTFKRHFNHWGCDLPRLTPDDLWPDPEFYMMFLYIRHCVFFLFFTVWQNLKMYYLIK